MGSYSQDYREDQQTRLRDSPDPHPLRPYYESGLGSLETFGNPTVYVAESEASWLYTPVDNLSGLPRHDDLADVVVKPAEHTFVFHEEYQLEEFRFTVLPTPGHSIGGVSIVFPDAHLVFTGDALFRETIGRTDLPTGSTEQLLHSIQTQLFTLPNYDVYPGHGPATTIAHEKTFNPFSNKQKPRKFSLVLSYQIITRSSGERHMPSPSLTSYVVKKSSKFGT